jgi:hypothetical protein
VLVRVLDVFVYECDGRSWHKDETRNPTRKQIEAAILNLDKFCHPFLFLQLHEGEDMGDDRFEVMGGPGAYWIADSFGGYCQRRYVNPDGGSNEIDVWTSDQGFADEGRYICKDVDVVIGAAKYFVNHGDFDTSITWE